MSIKRCRERAGKTIKEVQDYMGVSDSAVYQWELGNYCPKPDKLLKLARFLGVSVEELLKEE